MSRISQAVGIGVASALLAGCGSATSAPRTASDSPSKSSPPSSATAKPADAATIALAIQSTVSSADLGPNWVVTEQPTVDVVSADDCASINNTLRASLPVGAAQTGPVAHYKESKYYALSRSTVYATEADARAWIEVRKSPAYVECGRKKLETFEQKTDPKWSVVVRDIPTPGLGEAGWEAYTFYQARYDGTAGPADANGNFARFAYRVGRIVVTLNLDVVQGPADPPNLFDLVSAEIHHAVGTLYGRLRAAQ